MTTLSITANLAKKTAKLTGVVAAGEHVAVTVADGAALSTATLKLRVMFCGKTCAMFPIEDADAWTASGDDLTCELNLNTQQMMKFCRAPEQPCLFVLEDTGANTLHFTAEHAVKGWPPGRGDDELVNLDGYVAKVDEMSAALAALVANFNAHAARTDNPHGVTAAQVGLGNVDDTADRDKPVSTAQAAAITAAAAGVSASVTTEVTRATNAENALAVEIDALGSRVDALNADVTVADAKADVAKSAADAAKSAADAQKERLDNVRTAVAEISKPKASINSLKASIEALLTALEEM